MMQSQENAWAEGRMEGLKGEQTLFYTTLPATAGCPRTDCHEDIQIDTKTKKKI